MSDSYPRRKQAGSNMRASASSLRVNKGNGNGYGSNQTTPVRESGSNMGIKSGMTVEVENFELYTSIDRNAYLTWELM